MMKEENVFMYTDQAILARIQRIQSDINDIRRQESDMVARRIELKNIKAASNGPRPDLDAEMEDLWRKAMHFSNQIKDLESKIEMWNKIQDAGMYARGEEEKLKKRANMAAMLQEQNAKSTANQLKGSVVDYKIVKPAKKHARRRPDMPLWAHVFPGIYGRKMLKRADRAIAAERAAQAEKNTQGKAEIKPGSTISERLGLEKMTVSMMMNEAGVNVKPAQTPAAEKPVADEIKLGNTISESLGMKTVSEVLFGKPVAKQEPVAQPVAEKPVIAEPVDEIPVLEKPIIRKQVLLAEKSVVAEPVVAKQESVVAQDDAADKMADEWIMSFAKIRADMEQKRAAEQADVDAEKRAQFEKATNAMFHLNEYMGNNIKTIGDILNEETQEIPVAANGEDFVVLRGAELAEYNAWKRMGTLRTFLNHGNRVMRNYDKYFANVHGGK